MQAKDKEFLSVMGELAWYAAEAGAVTSCPGNPPPPTGYRVWQRKGGVPAVLGQWAVDTLHQSASQPYGFTWSIQYQDQTIIARKDYHTWTWRGGQLVTGICIPGITLYEPIPVGLAMQAADTTDMTLVGIFNDPNADASGSGGLNVPWGWLIGGVLGGALAMHFGKKFFRA